MERRGSNTMRKNVREVWGGLLILLVICSSVFAETAEEILERVDKNTVVATASYRAKMIISLGGTIREKEFTGYAKGKEFAYMEFTSPARDKGTRFLKIGDEMWIYLPEVEKATKIAGHMLRQSMMGSDFSYDDVAENERLLDLYDAKLVGVDSIDGVACHALELTAKVEEINYYKRKIWVSKESFIAMREELYAKSGKLMKEITVGEFEKMGSRNYPTKVTMVNKLRKDTYTELVLEDVKLDISIPSRIFTKSYLERK
jgi:outer membrane lipoprotein-sorting protein